MIPTSLTISDSSDTGCQLDLQHFQRHNSFGFTCFTAVPTTYPNHTHLFTANSIEEQIKTTLIGGPIKSTKIGKIYTQEQLIRVTDCLLHNELGTIVIDLPLLSEHISQHDQYVFLHSIRSLPVILCGSAPSTQHSLNHRALQSFFTEVTLSEQSSPLSALITALSSQDIKGDLLVETIKKALPN